MSLPDTVFIFVLALIIFGPKKLPEIGRQIGKLVGEFRRASNEFKFQIEEELRQADITDKPSNRIAAPVESAVQAPALAAEAQDPAANLPVGQHPNIEMLNTAELEPSAMELPASGSSGLEPANLESANAAEPAVPTITPAEGTEARTSIPFAAANPSVENLEIAAKATPENAPSSPEVPASANRTPAAVETGITHG